MDTLLIISILVVVILGFGLLLRRWTVGKSGDSREAELAVLGERLQAQQSDKARLEDDIKVLNNHIETLNQTVQLRDQNAAELRKELAITQNQLATELEQNKEKIELLKGAREELSNQFKVLANSILEEKSKTFKEENRSSIGEILNPLKERLGEFQKKIQENYESEGKERHSLRNEVQKLMEMNNRLSKEASNLTNALKGESKTQGNWGEMILERILEISGLRKGEEYTVQESYNREDGSRVQPDVVIHLPEDRHMVIDSKVSVNAYDTYMNSDNDEEQKEALKEHIASIRTHMKGLAAKEYHKLHEEKSPDFVIMFIPIEAAFMTAISEDGKLWEDAWRNNILLVSSSTLLFVMRIVMQLWRQEHRSQNALDIAKRGGLLYEKLVGFIEDFEEVGTRIEQTRRSFENAKGKLSTGRGNAIRQAEMLKELGITTGKQIPDSFVEKSKDEEPHSHDSQPYLPLN